MPLIAPVLAQVVALNAGVGTDVASTFSREGALLQASAAGRLGATLSGRRAMFGLEYTPSAFATGLESAEPRYTFLNAVTASTGVTVGGKRTTFQLLATAQLSQRNLLLEALSGTTPTPATTGSTEPTDAGASSGSAASDAGTSDAAAGQSGTDTGTSPVSDTAVNREGNILTGSGTVRATLSHRLSKTANAAGGVGYEVAGEIGGGDNRQPWSYGPTANVDVAKALSSTNALGASASGRYVESTEDDRAWSVAGGVAFTHRFSLKSSGGLSAGAAYSRSEPHDDDPTNTLQPTATANLAYRTPYAKGQFNASVAVGYAPSLDRASLRFDPRFAVSTALGWERGPFGISESTSTTLSIHPNQPSGAENVASSLTLTYDLGYGFRVDGGGRMAWQRYAGNEIVPPTWGLFAGLSWAATWAR
jgi:hypothetical protein